MGSHLRAPIWLNPPNAVGSSLRFKAERAARRRAALKLFGLFPTRYLRQVVAETVQNILSMPFAPFKGELRAPAVPGTRPTLANRIAVLDALTQAAVVALEDVIPVSARHLLHVAGVVTASGAARLIAHRAGSKAWVTHGRAGRRDAGVARAYPTAAIAGAAVKCEPSCRRCKHRRSRLRAEGGSVRGGYAGFAEVASDR